MVIAVGGREGGVSGATLVCLGLLIMAAGVDQAGRVGEAGRSTVGSAAAGAGSVELPAPSVMLLPSSQLDPGVVTGLVTTTCRVGDGELLGGGDGVVVLLTVGSKGRSLERSILPPY